MILGAAEEPHLPRIQQTIRSALASLAVGTKSEHDPRRPAETPIPPKRRIRVTDPDRVDRDTTHRNPRRNSNLCVARSNRAGRITRPSRTCGQSQSTNRRQWTQNRTHPSDSCERHARELVRCHASIHRPPNTAQTNSDRACRRGAGARTLREWESGTVIAGRICTCLAFRPRRKSRTATHVARNSL